MPVRCNWSCGETIPSALSQLEDMQVTGKELVDIASDINKRGNELNIIAGSHTCTFDWNSVGKRHLIQLYKTDKLLTFYSYFKSRLKLLVSPILQLLYNNEPRYCNGISQMLISTVHCMLVGRSVCHSEIRMLYKHDLSINWTLVKSY